MNLVMCQFHTVFFIRLVRDGGIGVNLSLHLR